MKKLQVDFNADLHQAVLEKLQIIPVAGGAITAEGIIKTNLAKSLASKQGIDPAKMPLEFKFSSELPIKDLVSFYYQLPTELTVGNLQASGTVTGTIDELDAAVSWQLPAADDAGAEDISGSGALLLANNQLQLQNTQVKLGKGVAEIKAQANLDNQQWQSNITANSLSLNSFLTQFHNPHLNLERPISLQKLDLKLKGKLDELEINKVTGFADVNLSIDADQLTVSSNLAGGIISGNVNTNEIDLNRLVTGLPIAATVRSSRTNFSGELQQLLTWQENTNLSSFLIDVDADLNLASGTVNAFARLKNNQLRASIDAYNISSLGLLNNFDLNNLTSENLDNINGQIDISGSLNPVADNEVNIPLAINRAAIQSGNQNFNVKGDLTLSDITGNFDVTNTNLDVNANIDLERLPIEELLAPPTENNQLVADNINIQGKAEFNGGFKMKKLISSPQELGNISLKGDLIVFDLAINDLEFNSQMAGRVNIEPESEITLNLQGQEDRLAASAVPCRGENCRWSYVPNILEFRQGEGTRQPIIVTGKKNQDRFSLNINNFPLALLNLAPAKAVGIQGALKGNTTGKIALNLDNLATKGQVTVEKPGFGHILADRFAAEFNYDPSNNIAEVVTASLDLGQSQYEVQGTLNLQTAEMAGALNIPEAYIQDILTSFHWFTMEDFIDLFDIPDYVEPEEIDPTDEIYTVNESITKKLAQLRRIENQIQEIATERKNGGMPKLLDMRGQYTGLVTFAGSLEQPEINFNLEGKNWLWEPELPFTNIVHALGIVKEESQFISINQIFATGKLTGNVVTLERAKLEIENALLSARGEISPEGQDAQFTVENLSLDTVDKFIDIPVDTAGIIDLRTKVTGTLSQPEITGKLRLTDSALNGSALPDLLAGNFDYRNRKLKFTTTEPSTIQISATVPYPATPKIDDQIVVSAELGTEALALLGVFTQENLSWIGGEGRANLQATANYNLDRAIPFYNLDLQGAIALQQAELILTNPFFSAPIVATGTIHLKNQLIDVENLDATLAGKDLEIEGVLPIFQPIANLEDPLAVSIPAGKIDIDHLYKGNIAGNIIIADSALKPTIRGEVSLTDGKVFIPQNEQDEIYDSLELVTSQKQPDSVVKAKLDNFLVKFSKFKLENPLFYKFAVEGELLLNGTVDNPNNIRPEGELYLTQGKINYFLNSNFTLERNRQNSITFTPEAGILNPYLDILLQTTIYEFNQADVRAVELEQNQIRDPIAQANYRNSIRVNLVIDGEVEKIWQDLSQITNSGITDICEISSNETFFVDSNFYYTEAELEQFTTCFNDEALTEQELFNLSAVGLTSIPFRNRAEITNLLTNNFLLFTESLNHSSQSELFNLGFNTFVLSPLIRDTFYNIDYQVVKLGRKMGLDYLHLVPDLEGVYEINQNSALRGSYNYGLPNSHEVRLEYQLKF